MMGARDAYLSTIRNKRFYEFQEEFSNQLIEAVITKGIYEIDFEISRQAGKTDGVSETVVFLLTCLDMLFNRKIGIGFFAPREDQYMTDWVRIREIYPQIAPLYGLKNRIDNDTEMVFARPLEIEGGIVKKWANRYELFGFSLGEGTKVESKTLDIAIIEEAQDIDDQKVDKMVRPMLTATNGVLIRIGVAGYKKCDFQKGVQTNPRAIVWNFEKVMKARRKVYEETGDPWHLGYESFIEAERKRIGGVITDEFRTQYMLEWITEIGNMISREELMKIKKSAVCCASNVIDIGIDLGKSKDQTVGTAVTELGQRLSSIQLSGTKYRDQRPLLKDWIDSLEEKGYRVRRVTIDSSGAGDPNFEEFEHEWSDRDWDLVAFVFGSQSKSNLYHNFLNKIAVGVGIAEGRVKDIGQPRVEYWGGDDHVEMYESEMLDMEKEYRGSKDLLDCHHPKGNRYHDDHPDSHALAIYEDPDDEGELGAYG